MRTFLLWTEFIPLLQVKPDPGEAQLGEESLDDGQSACPRPSLALPVRVETEERQPGLPSLGPPLQLELLQLPEGVPHGEDHAGGADPEDVVDQTRGG